MIDATNAIRLTGSKQMRTFAHHQTLHEVGSIINSELKLRVFQSK